MRALLFLPVLAAALPVAAVAQGPISPGRQVTGIIASNDEVMEDKEKLKVMVHVFGRATPVVLDYTNVEKA